MPTAERRAAVPENRTTCSVVAIHPFLVRNGSAPYCTGYDPVLLRSHRASNARASHIFPVEHVAFTSLRDCNMEGAVAFHHFVLVD